MPVGGGCSFARVPTGPIVRTCKCLVCSGLRAPVRWYPKGLTTHARSSQLLLIEYFDCLCLAYLAICTGIRIGLEVGSEVNRADSDDSTDLDSREGASSDEPVGCPVGAIEKARHLVDSKGGICNVGQWDTGSAHVCTVAVFANCRKLGQIALGLQAGRIRTAPHYALAAQSQLVFLQVYLPEFSCTCALSLQNRVDTKAAFRARLQVSEASETRLMEREKKHNDNETAIEARESHWLADGCAVGGD